MSNKINTTRIATEVAKSVAARFANGILEETQNLDGDTLMRDYAAKYGNLDGFTQSLRIQDLVGSSPERLFWLAGHHFKNAIERLHFYFTQSNIVCAVNEPDPKECCKYIARCPKELLDRLAAVFTALESLGIDPDGLYAQEYEKMVIAFNESLTALDLQTEHLKDPLKWHIRLQCYRKTANFWYETEWKPFANLLIDQTAMRATPAMQDVDKMLK
jgi:hypothetical protein